MACAAAAKLGKNPAPTAAHMAVPSEFAFSPATYSGMPVTSAFVLRLTAPRVDDTAETTLGGAPVQASGAWSSASTDKIKARNGTVTLHLPKASGALVSFGP